MIKISKNIEITIESYNQTAEDYSEKTLDINTESQINKFLSYLKKPSILDIGCGPGRDAKIFSDKGYDVIGIDLSDNLLNIAKGHAPKATFMNMDILNLTFPKNKFDGLWAMASLMHLEKNQLPYALDECSKILKDGEPFYFCLKRGEEAGLEPDKRYEGVEKYFAYYQDNEVREILKKTNFKILEFESNTVDKNYATKPWMDIYVQKIE